MRKENNVQNIVIILLAVVVLVMTVGYAAFASTLTINSSTATFKKAKWDVHFDTTTYNQTSTIQATSHTESNTSLTFAVTLNKPGDVYTFTINAKNFGTIDAVMKKITMSGLTAAEAKYISYKINYNGTDYTETTDNLSHALAAEASHTVTVTVKYEIPNNSADLPTEEDHTVTLTAAFDYEDSLS